MVDSPSPAAECIYPHTFRDESDDNAVFLCLSAPTVSGKAKGLAIRVAPDAQRAQEGDTGANASVPNSIPIFSDDNSLHLKRIFQPNRADASPMRTFLATPL